MERTTLWSRFGGWLRDPAGKGGRGESIGAQHPQGQSTGADVDPAPGTAVLAKREPTDRERLDTTLTKVADLIESIQHHLTSQDERTQRITDSLQSIATSLADLPQTTQKQTEALDAIRQHLETDIAMHRRTEDALSEMPRIADAQRETMVSIGRHIDAVRQTQDDSAAAVGEVRGSVDRLESRATDNLTAIKQMHIDGAARDDRLTLIVQEQTKRLTWFAAAAIAVAAVAAVMGIIALGR